MVTIEVKSGDLSMLLEADNDALSHFMINDDSPSARQFLLQLMSAGYLDTSVWDEQRLQGHLNIRIPSLDLEYILNPDPEVESLEDQTLQQPNRNAAVEPSTGPFFWTHDGILNLISLYKENKENFSSTTVRNEKIWREIALKLKNNGFGSPTPKQVEQKWKNLRKCYSKVVDNRGPNSSGAPSISFKYFDEFQEIYIANPSYHPPTIASSMRPNNVTHDLVDPLQEPPKKKKKTVDYIADIINEQSQRQDQIIKEIRNATDTFAEKLDKLINKL